MEAKQDQVVCSRNPAGGSVIAHIQGRKPGAGERSRTFTALRPTDFESAASAIPPLRRALDSTRPARRAKADDSRLAPTETGYNNIRTHAAILRQNRPCAQANGKTGPSQTLRTRERQEEERRYALLIITSVALMSAATVSPTFNCISRTASAVITDVMC